MSYCETLCCAGICQPEEDDIYCATCICGKLNLVLDLDETLVTAQNKILKFDNVLPFCCFDDYDIYKRPHVDVFLDIVFKKYNVYIWTAACKSYADFVLKNLLTPNQIPVRVLTRRDTMFRKTACGLYWSREDAIKIKPLGKLKCNLARTVLVDDTASCFLLDRPNGIQIPQFNDPATQLEDTELMDILQKLDQFSDFKDVRVRKGMINEFKNHSF